MKKLLPLVLGLCLAAPATARGAYEEEGLSEAAVSTDTVRNGEEEEEQPLIQENDEDLAAFVTDYIRKDIQLKGAFFIENRRTKTILKLELVSVEGKAAGTGNGVKTVTAVFKDAAGKKTAVLFHLQNGPWGGVDIFKLELEVKAGKTGGGKKL